MLKRTLSSIILLPLLIFVVYKGGVILRTALMLLSFLGMTEFFRAACKTIKPAHFLAYAFSAVYYLSYPYFSRNTDIVLFAAFLIGLLIFMAAFHQTVNIFDVAISAFGFFYVTFLLFFIYLTRMYTHGLFFVWLIFISAWGSDTFAYFSGKFLGRHKLCPKLSPKKTVEGAVGGVVGATLLGVIYASVWAAFGVRPELNWVLFVTVICGVGAAFSQMGDLAASAIKRYTGIKDFGHVIPGHGGILDRFDSLLFTAPGVYGVVYVLLKYL